MNNVSEDYTLTNLGIPVLLKFRTNPAKKIGIFAHAGILSNISSSVESNLNGGTANYEAEYGSTDGMIYNSNVQGTIYDLRSTVQQYMAHNSEATSSDIKAHFEDRYNDNFNIGIDIPLQSDGSSTDISTGINLTARIGLLYNISDRVALQIGGQYLTGTLVADDSYKVIDIIQGNIPNQYGEYNSLLNGGSTYSAFGVNVGLSMRLGSKK